MHANITKWGNSLGLRIPRALANEAGIQEGTQVEIFLNNHQIIIRKTYSLESLLEQITPDNIHKEKETGPIYGKELL